MKQFRIDGNLGKFEINFPESLSEISVEYLNTCTEFVYPAPNYAVVAIIYKDSLSLVLNAAKKNKPANVSVVPVFIKTGQTDSEFINNIKAGDRVVIAASDLSIAHHINSPYNKLTPNNVVNVCEGDKQIYSDALIMRSPVCFIEFKLVPVSAIHAQLDETKNSFINPFIRKATEIAGEA